MLLSLGGNYKSQCILENFENILKIIERENVVKNEKENTCKTKFCPCNLEYVLETHFLITILFIQLFFISYILHYKKYYSNYFK